MNAIANRCPDLPANCSVSRLAVFVALVTCIVLASLTFDAEKVEGLLVWVQDNKREGSVLFLLVYTLGVVLMFPAMVMAMAAGAVFGMLWGTLLVWLGSTIGQTLAFVVGRYLLRELVVQYLSRQFPKWTAIDKALESEGWKLVTLLRLSPIAPWNVLNYALSVTAVPLAAYVAASSFAILPYLLLFVYFGSLARNLADVFTGRAGLGTNATMVMAATGGVLMVLIVVYTTHISRKAISNALLTSSDEQTVEMAADPDVAELLRVNSQEMADHLGSPTGTGRSSLQHHTASTFASSAPARDGGMVELAGVLIGGGGSGSGGKSSAFPPPQLLSQQQQQQQQHAKKKTPATDAERETLLDRLQQADGGGSSSGAGVGIGGASKVHQRSSATGGGQASSSTSPLAGILGAMRR
ncbi:TVP38/TMEM64 family membrane protein [Chlorella vulgaris]